MIAVVEVFDRPARFECEDASVVGVDIVPAGWCEAAICAVALEWLACCECLGYLCIRFSFHVLVLSIVVSGGFLVRSFPDFQ